MRRYDDADAYADAATAILIVASHDAASADSLCLMPYYVYHCCLRQRHQPSPLLPRQSLDAPLCLL